MDTFGKAENEDLPEDLVVHLGKQVSNFCGTQKHCFRPKYTKICSGK